MMKDWKKIIIDSIVIVILAVLFFFFCLHPARNDAMVMNRVKYHQRRSDESLTKTFSFPKWCTLVTLVMS